MVTGSGIRWPPNCAVRSANGADGGISPLSDTVCAIDAALATSRGVIPGSDRVNGCAGEAQRILAVSPGDGSANAAPVLVAVYARNIAARVAWSTSRSGALMRSSSFTSVKSVVGWPGGTEVLPAQRAIPGPKGQSGLAVSLGRLLRAESCAAGKLAKTNAVAATALVRRFGKLMC